MVIFYDELREMVTLMYGTYAIVHVGRICLQHGLLLYYFIGGGNG
jgi:hypothetical protein